MKHKVYIKNIWRCRPEKRYFSISKINEKSWYVILFGYEFWFGPNKPGFVGTERG